MASSSDTRTRKKSLRKGEALQINLDENLSDDLSGFEDSDYEYEPPKITGSRVAYVPSPANCDQCFSYDWISGR